MALGRGISIQAGQVDQHVLNWTWPQASAGGRIDPYCEDQESKAVGISLDRDIVQSSSPSTDFLTNPFWTVKWSAGNLTQTVELDVLTGSFMTVFGSMVSVSCSYPATNPPGSTTPTLNVRAVLGFDGGRQSPGITSVPKRTITIGALNQNATSTTFPIPRFAIAAIFSDEVPTNTGMTLQQSRSLNIGAGTIVSSALIGKLDQDTVPIVNGATHFNVINTAGAGSSSLSIIFYLAV